MPAALILALTIPALAASAEPQLAVPAPREAAPRDASQETKAGGVIRGRITSLDTGKPLRRAQVRLTADELVPPPPLTASTSSDGRYELRDVPPGRYTLRSSAAATSRSPTASVVPANRGGRWRSPTRRLQRRSILRCPG